MDFEPAIKIIDCYLKFNENSIRKAIIKKIRSDAYSRWRNDYLNEYHYSPKEAYNKAKDEYRQRILDNEMYEMNHGSSYSATSIELWHTENDFFRLMIKITSEIHLLISVSDENQPIFFDDIEVYPFSG